MLKANELRIGNIVYDPINKSNIQVRQEVLCDFANGYVNLEPIPLTEEWLIKFGFEVEYNSEYTKRFSLDNERNDFIWVYTYRKHNSTEFLEYGGRVLGCKYVYQLQNLYFALTGEELTIKNL